MKRIAILASGTGSNARKIHERSLSSENYEVACILSNRKNARVLDYANEHGITSYTFSKADLNGEVVLDYLKKECVDLVVLAGFLLLIPESIVNAYPNRIINIHPSLLPKHGGKGMYGSNVHNAVSEAKDMKSGMTIHLVNERYDEGKYLFQASVKINSDDTPDTIGKKVLALEHHYYPQVVEGICRYL